MILEITHECHTDTSLRYLCTDRARLELSYPYVPRVLLRYSSRWHTVSPLNVLHTNCERPIIVHAGSPFAPITCQVKTVFSKRKALVSTLYIRPRSTRKVVHVGKGRGPSCAAQIGIYPQTALEPFPYDVDMNDGMGRLKKKLLPSSSLKLVY